MRKCKPTIIIKTFIHNYNHRKRLKKRNKQKKKLNFKCPSIEWPDGTDMNSSEY